MKKLILASIILAVSFFSISNHVFAFDLKNEGEIEKLLDLNVGPDEYDLELAHIDSMTFMNPAVTKMYNEYKILNSQLKRGIMAEYRKWNIEYYQLQGMITAQKNFVYHTNKVFFHIWMKEQFPDYAEADEYVLKNYRAARSNFVTVKNLMHRKY